MNDEIAGVDTLALPPLTRPVLQLLFLLGNNIVTHYLSQCCGSKSGRVGIILPDLSRYRHPGPAGRSGTGSVGLHFNKYAVRSTENYDTYDTDEKKDSELCRFTKNEQIFHEENVQILVLKNLTPEIWMNYSTKVMEAYDRLAEISSEVQPQVECKETF